RNQGAARRYRRRGEGGTMVGADSRGSAGSRRDLASPVHRCGPRLGRTGRATFGWPWESRRGIGGSDRKVVTRSAVGTSRGPEGRRRFVGWLRGGRLEFRGATSSEEGDGDSDRGDDEEEPEDCPDPESLEGFRPEAIGRRWRR